ncbi:ion transporter [Methanobrevibacter sp.]|uniref:ion transporter n=1 Tax=Methanobrevibacter sp. TaxID=66852 RepID=UPI003866B72E
MKIWGKDINLKFFLWFYCFNGLIIIDMILITISLIFQIPANVATDIQNFDLIVCIILLVEYALNLYLSSPKKDFILDPLNIVGLIASIPFDIILSAIIPHTIVLRYLRLFKLTRIFLLSSRLKFIKELFEKTGLHKIFGGIIITILLFTLLFEHFGPHFDFFNSFYFVIVTLTTVGYGDVTPKTYNEKVLSIILILIGIFVFSTITAMMSSFFTDNILEDDEEDIKDEIKEVFEEKSENIMNELKNVHEENKGLKNEINELKDEINELKDLINNK